jgi:Uri superfamily endonuclease
MLYCPFDQHVERCNLAQKGVYILVLNLPAEETISIGRLGPVCFPAGRYLYTGSAMGPGGLAARVARHCRNQKKLHWHIDYLLASATVEEIWWQATEERIECRWAVAALSLPGACVPAPRFGASDCTCPAHLVHLVSPDPAAFAKLAGIPESELEVRLHGRSPGCPVNG